MSWKNILKNDLKNEIDAWAKSQDNPSGPLTIIFQQNKQGPHERASNMYFVNNEQQFKTRNYVVDEQTYNNVNIIIPFNDPSC